MKSVALHNLGCKVNSYEMDVMQQMLQQKGYKVVPFDEQADIYIVNTCSVTNIADRKSRQMLHRAKKLNPRAVVVAVGCYVQTAGEEALKDESIDLAVGNNRKKDLISIIEEYLACQGGKRLKKECGHSEYNDKGNADCTADKTLKGSTVIDIGHTNEYESMTLTGTAEHTRAFIKIQDGCNQFCSYCIIPYARGRVRSRDMDEILNEIRGLADNGYREVVLTGIHISSYGTDFASGNENAFSDLLKRIHEIEGIKRIRLGSLEPRIITEEFVQMLSSLDKICPHFHLSLQSGCDATLNRMNRKYTTGEYWEKVCILRQAFHDPAITTDVITGFPGETREEFLETMQFLEKAGFYEMHIFKYSKRKGTRAAAMDCQIPEAVKAERSSALMELEEKMSKEYRDRYLHKPVQVLWEEEKEFNGVLFQIGHTQEYIKAAVTAGENLSGQILSGKLYGFLQDDILLFKPQTR